MDDMQPVMTVFLDGSKLWRNANGDLHRVDGPAVIYADGHKEWWQNCELHRDDGPAVINADGDKFWCQHGKFHRVDGPAIEYADGDKSWYQHDIYLTFDKWLAKNHALTEEDKVMMKLQYG
jgi:hypothetical protein